VKLTDDKSKYPLKEAGDIGKIEISDFRVDIPGESLNQERDAFNRNLCQENFMIYA